VKKENAVDAVWAGRTLSSLSSPRSRLHDAAACPTTTLGIDWARARSEEASADCGSVGVGELACEWQHPAPSRSIVPRIAPKLID
jgi:hypothetical protein